MLTKVWVDNNVLSHFIIFILFIYLFCPVTLQQCESCSESRCEVCNLHGLDVVDGFGELSNVFVGCLIRFIMEMFIMEE